MLGRPGIDTEGTDHEGIDHEGIETEGTAGAEITCEAEAGSGTFNPAYELRNAKSD